MLFLGSKESIIREVKTEKRKTRVVSPPKMMTLKEILFSAQSSIFNKGKDGRLNYKNKNGQCVASSISPYAENFDRNIEPKLKKSISRLLSKGYLTLSSCQGHCRYSRRYITLAFYSRERAQQFVRELGMGLFSYKYIEMQDYMNTSMEIKKGKVANLEKVDYKFDRETCLFSLNSMYLRDYQNYHFLELEMSKEFQPGEGRKNIFSILYKYLLLPALTKIFEKRLVKISNYEM